MKKTIQQVILFSAIILAGNLIAYKMIHIPKQSELVVLFAFVMLYPVFKFPLVGVYTAFIVSPIIPFIRRLYYLVHGRPGVDPLIMLTDVIVVVVFLGLYFEFRERSKDGESGFWLKLVAFYLVYCVIRTFFLNILPLSDGLAKLKYYAPSVILFYIGFVYAHRFAHVKRLWVLTVVLGFASCLYGLKQLYFGYSSAEKVWFSSIYFTTLFIKGVARPFSFFQAPAAFADYLTLSIIGFFMVLEWGRKKSRFLLVPAVLLLFYGILITSVRSNWIGALAVFFFWFVFLRMKKASHRILIIAVTAAVFFSYQLMDEMLSSGLGIKNMTNLISGNVSKQGYLELLVTTRTSAITNPFEEHSLISRMALWRYLFDSSISPDKGLFGRGLGSLNADSLYFTYLAEFGYPGLIFILFITIGFIVQGLRAFDRLSDGRSVVLVKGIVVMDMVFALMNITGSHINSFPGDMYFWFFNGVLINIFALDRTLAKQQSDA
jgi:hypothetical protein